MKKLKLLFFTAITKTIAGAFFLYAANVLIQRSGLHISINLFTAFIAGSLGLPGIIALAAIHFFLFK